MKLGYVKPTFKYPQQIQIEALLAQRCDKIYEQPANNSTYSKIKIQQELKQGDTVVAYNLVAIGESVKELLEVLLQFKENGINLQLVQNELMVDKSYSMEYLLRIILNFINDVKYNKQQEGLKQARLKGKHIGRKPKLTKRTTKKAIEYREKYSIEKVAKLYGVGKSTLLRHIANYGLKSA